MPRFVASVLSRHLHREVGVTDCGFADRAPAPDDRFDGLRSSGSLGETVRTVVGMTARDLKRRTFLLGSTFTAAAFSEPALFAMTTPTVAGVGQKAGRRVGTADVEVIVQTLAHLRRLDHRYGSERVREQVVALLHRGAATVEHGSYTERTGKALVAAVAQAAWLAGSVASDIGRHSLAQRYYIQALNLALSAGDRPYAANVLSHMSRLTVQIGRGTIVGHDRERHARQAVSLARAGLAVGTTAASPGLSALPHAVEARAHALLGEASSARVAMRAAENAHRRCHEGNEPEWLGFHTRAELLADLGRCLHDIDDHDAAIRSTGAALAGYEPWRVRSRCLVNDLAAAHLARGDWECAAELGRTAVRTADQVSSTRTSDRLRVLQRQLRLLPSTTSCLQDLDRRLAEHLAGRRPRRSGAVA